MNSHFDALVDSDAWVGFFVEQDVHFARTKQAFAASAASHQVLVTTNLVVVETATLLSRRIRHSLACQFVAHLHDLDFPILYVDTTIQAHAARLFLDTKQEGTSMVDCVNVATVRHFGIPAMLSFDRFYARNGIALFA